MGVLRYPVDGGHPFLVRREQRDLNRRGSEDVIAAEERPRSAEYLAALPLRGRGLTWRSGERNIDFGEHPHCRLFPLTRMAR